MVCQLPQVSAFICRVMFCSGAPDYQDEHGHAGLGPNTLAGVSPSQRSNPTSLLSMVKVLLGQDRE